MSNRKYSEEFKLAVVKEYYEGILGVRLLAKKYNLPSKNYITNWIEYFKKKGIIPLDLVPKHSSSNTADSISNVKTGYEKELEKEVERLKAENAFLKKCKELINISKKKL